MELKWEMTAIIGILMIAVCILLHQNSPVDSRYIISSLSDIDRVIHTKGKNYLHPQKIEQIIRLLQGDCANDW